MFLYKSFQICVNGIKKGSNGHNYHDVRTAAQRYRETHPRSNTETHAEPMSPDYKRGVTYIRSKPRKGTQCLQVSTEQADSKHKTQGQQHDVLCKAE